MKPDLGNLMQKVQEMQDKATAKQEELAKLEVIGESGGGLVKITLTGHRDAKNVTIDDSLLSEDKEVLEDLIAAAINDAERKVEKITQEQMSDITGGIELPAGMKLPF